MADLINCLEAIRFDDKGYLEDRTQRTNDWLNLWQKRIGVN